MNINNTNQSGFGVVGVLLIVVLFLGVGGAGYYAWSQSSSPDSESTESTSSVNEADATVPPEVESGEPSNNDDNTVQTDLGRIMAGINNYSANNNGRFPESSEEITDFEQTFLADINEHPVSGLPYTIDESKSSTHEVIDYQNGSCASDGSIQAAESSRQVALSIALPSGNLFCIDN